MSKYVHLRHKQPTLLQRERGLVVACVPMKSNINLSQIARTASCCGIKRMICCGTAKLIDKIARDGVSELNIEIHRTLAPMLKNLREEGYRLVGLEQTTNSQNLHNYAFAYRSALIVGNERTGLSEEILALLADVIEIPVYALPHSYNVATATSMALYEYCRQFPQG